MSRTAPFSPSFPIRSIEDIRRLEQTPLSEALTVRSTYEIFRNAARGLRRQDGADLPAQRPTRPTQPIRWSYAELLAGIHQTANLLHALGVGPERRGGGAAAGLPRIPPGAVGRRSGRHRAAAQPAADRREAGLADDRRPRQGADRLRLGRRVGHVVEGDAPARPGAHADDACCAWRRTTRRRAAPARCPRAWPTSTHCAPREPADRLVSGRDIAPTDIAAYFHTGGTTGAPKLARHSHGAQVFTAWASVKLQGLRADDVTHQRLSAVPRGGRAAGLAGLRCRPASR